MRLLSFINTGFITWLCKSSLVLAIVLAIVLIAGCPNISIIKPHSTKSLSKIKQTKGLERITPATNTYQHRVALIIGNNNYQYVDKLNNAVADARAFRKELTTRGFKIVYKENAKRREMNRAINKFISKLAADSISIIYYSGHGVQINNANYLLPIDIKAEFASDVMDDGIALEDLLNRTSQTGTKFTLAIIDACRNNPFRSRVRRRSIGGIGRSKGLAPPLGNATGIMIVYSAGANQEALDKLGAADPNPNGLFTREFLKAMRIPGLRVQQVVERVKMKVITQARQVGHVQTPAIYDQSVGTFYFSKPEPESKTTASQIATPPKPDPQVAKLQARLRAEEQRRKEAERQARIANEEADRKIAAAKMAAKEAAKRQQAQEAAKRQQAQEAAIAAQKQHTKPTTEYHTTEKNSKTYKPKMITIPAGSFRMGDIQGNGNSDEKPVHKIHIKTFKISKHEITRGQFRAFVNATQYKTEAEQNNGCYIWTGSNWQQNKQFNWRNVGFSQNDHHPVVCVSWNDAMAYLKWITQKTKTKYRLPTEAEWEYAARAGTSTKYWWGNEIGHNKANCYDCGSKWDNKQTAPVGAFAANPWGLYDTVGNVWEWTCSEYQAPYAGKEQQCVVDTSSVHVIRSGSWLFNAANVRTARRFRYRPTYCNNEVGFRIVQSQ